MKKSINRLTDPEIRISTDLFINSKLQTNVNM